MAQHRPAARAILGWLNGLLVVGGVAAALAGRRRIPAHLCERSLMLTSLAWGHPIRVGLDVGTGVEVERGQLYGPAVVKAYELESRAAEYPRVIVGDTLADYLQAQ